MQDIIEDASWKLVICSKYCWLANGGWAGGIALEGKYVDWLAEHVEGFEENLLLGASFSSPLYYEKAEVDTIKLKI